MRLSPRILTLLVMLIVLTPAAHAEDELLMGVFPRRSASQTIDMFTPLANYLGEQLGRPVRLVTSKDFSTFWEGVKEKRYDIVHYNQYHYIQSADKYEVIANIQEQESDFMRGALYVRSDSDITDIDQLKGRTVIFGGGTDAMMSYIVPRYLLQQAGLGEKDYTTVFANNPLNAVLAVYYHKADAGGAGDVVKKLPKITSIIDSTQLSYLAISDPVRQLPWCVRKDMPEALHQQIQRLMTSLDKTPEGQAVIRSAGLTGISLASDSDYDSARSIIRSVLPASEP